MQNLITKKCKYENCSEYTKYNYENEIDGLYCNSHKLIYYITY